MLVSRAHSAPRLPSFDELMLLISTQPPLHPPAFPQGNPLSISNLHIFSTAAQRPHAAPYATSPPAGYGTSPPPLRTQLPLLPLLGMRTPPAAPDGIALPLDPAEPKPEDERAAAAASARRKHACKTCGRSFTTLGHLARHNRTHTGERKHVCPWPQCLARFARQDNCMQHYKTHMNGKSRRNRAKKA